MRTAAIRRLAWSVVSLLWVAALVAVVVDHTGSQGRTIRLGVYAACSAITTQPEVTAAPVVSIGFTDSSRVTVTLDASLRTKSQGCYLDYVGSFLIDELHVTTDGAAVAIPQQAPRHVSVPGDGRSHAVHLTWTQPASLGRDGVGRSTVAFTPLLRLPTASTDNLDGPPQRLLDVETASEILTTPPGTRPVAFPGAVVDGRRVAFGIATGGFTVPTYTVAWDRPSVRWIAVAAPLVLSAATTALLFGIGLRLVRRRTRDRSADPAT